MPILGRSRSRKVRRTSLPPRQAVLLVVREKRPRKPAAAPQGRLVDHADLVQTGALHLEEFDAAGQGFRRLSQQVGRGAAQQQKPGGIRLPVRQHPQDRKEIRSSLDLVDHHQPRGGAQDRLGLREAFEDRWIFEVENRGVRVTAGEGAGERGLAALPGGRGGR